MKVFFPVNEKSGLEGYISQHFGSARYFFIADVDEESKEVKNTGYIDNVPHEMGGCMAPVRLLHDNTADILVVGGIGMRPLMGFMQVGIEVKHDGDHTKIGDIINQLDQMPTIERSTCQGSAH